MNYFVYMMTNQHKTVVYVGVTSNLPRRIYEHKTHLDKNSFTAKYNIDQLVYYEEVSDSYHAIEREKQIKGWNRKRKEKLIESLNPKWADLYQSIL